MSPFALEVHSLKLFSWIEFGIRIKFCKNNLSCSPFVVHSSLLFVNNAAGTPIACLWAWRYAAIPDAKMLAMYKVESPSGWLTQLLRISYDVIRRSLPWVCQMKICSGSGKTFPHQMKNRSWHNEWGPEPRAQSPRLRSWQPQRKWSEIKLNYGNWKWKAKIKRIMSRSAMRAEWGWWLGPGVSGERWGGEGWHSRSWNRLKQQAVRTSFSTTTIQRIIQ